MSAVHDYADRLLDLAYGELPPPEAKELEAHVRGCSQCTHALDDIRGVRKVMGQLPAAGEPDTGLESLMAYAEQAARRSAAGPETKGVGWRRWLAPVLGFTAVAALGAVTLTTLTTSKEMPSASQVAAEVKVEEMAMAPPAADLTPVVATPDEERKAGAKLALAEEKPAELRDEPAKNAVAMKPAAVMRKSADLDQQFAQDSDGLGKDRSRGGAGVGDLGGGGGYKGSGPYGGEQEQQQRVAEGKAKSGKSESYDDLAAASTGSSDRRYDPLTAAKKQPAREQSKTEEFAFDEAKADDKKADVAMSQNKTRARYESNEEDAAPAPVAQKETEERPATIAAVSADSETRKKSKGAAEDPNLVEFRRLIQLASQARAAGNRQAQAQYLRQATVLPIRNPVHANALIELGDVEYSLGNHSAADAAYRNALTYYPNTAISQQADINLRKTGNPYAPGQHRPADMPKEAEKRAIDAAEH